MFEIIYGTLLAMTNEQPMCSNTDTYTEATHAQRVDFRTDHPRSTGPAEAERYRKDENEDCRGVGACTEGSVGVAFGTLEFDENANKPHRDGLLSH